jgi:hypothetical protein
LKPDWWLKRDPEHQPVRFLAGIWEERTGTQLTPKELGQLKSLRKALGDLTRDVIEWMLNAVNWWHFCQQVRAESGLHHAPDHPHIGFLLRHHGRALKTMRCKLRDSIAPADVCFCTKLDRLRYEQLKALTLIYAHCIPERLAKIEAAGTLIEIEKVFVELADENTAVSQ